MRIAVMLSDPDVIRRLQVKALETRVDRNTLAEAYICAALEDMTLPPPKFNQQGNAVSRRVFELVGMLANSHPLNMIEVQTVLGVSRITADKALSSAMRLGFIERQTPTILGRMGRAPYTYKVTDEGRACLEKQNTCTKDPAPDEDPTFDKRLDDMTAYLSKNT